MGCDVVHDDDIPGFEGRNQALFNVGQKHGSVDRTGDHHGCCHAITSQSRDEAQCLPCSEGHTPGDPFAFWSATMGTGHVGVDRGLVNEDKARRIKQPLLADPAPPGAGDVGSLLLGSVQNFF